LPDTTIVPADDAVDAGSGLRDDVLSALTNLGYQRHSVEKAVDKALRAAPDASFEPVLRDVLRELSRS